ncbi:MAG: hypothetical protein ACK55Z_10970, partial [bacterium]
CHPDPSTWRIAPDRPTPLALASRSTKPSRKLHAPLRQHRRAFGLMLARSRAGSVLAVSYPSMAPTDPATARECHERPIVQSGCIRPVSGDACRRSRLHQQPGQR